MKSKAKKTLRYSVSSALALALVWFAFKKVDWSVFLLDLRMTRWGYIVLFAVSSVMAVVLRMLRWRKMLKPVCKDVPAIDTWDASNIGSLVNIVLPGAGEFIRCGAVARTGLPFGNVFGTIVMERVWDLLAVAVLIMAALLCKWSRFEGFFMDNIWTPLSGKFSVSLWVLLAAACVLFAAGLWAIFRLRERNALCGKIVNGVRSLFQGFASFAGMEHKWAFGAYTVGIWGLYVLMSFFVLKSVPAISSLNFSDTLFISAIGNIASVIPVPGGIGAYHYLVALTLSTLYGAAWETGILFATLSHELHAILILLLGTLSYICMTLRRKKK